MRVLIDYRPALRQRTGVGEYAHQLAAVLVPRLAPGQLALFSSSWKDRLTSDVVPGAATIDRRVPVAALNYLWHRLEWPPAEWLAGHVDVVHAMHPLLIPARGAARLVTVHDLFFLDNPERTSAEIRRDYPALAAAHARAADHVIAVSEYTAGQVVSRLGVPRERITIVPSGAPPWKPRPAGARGGPILFVGTIEPRKNVPALLEAYRQLVARLPSAPGLVLAGGAASPEGRAVLDAMARPPLAGAARHVGYVSGSEREQLYRGASMLVLPSLDEGFGLPALEAMTIGVPVIVSNRGALPEVVGDAGLLVEPGDIDGLTAAMASLARDDALARRCHERGIARAAHYNWSASADMLLGAYRCALAHRARGAS